MKLSELSYKDVIREEDGTKLGRIQDITIDAATGKILSIHLNNNFKFNIFSVKEQMMIPWNKIVKIGSDVIIVETVHNIKMELENKT